MPSTRLDRRSHHWQLGDHRTAHHTKNRFQRGGCGTLSCEICDASVEWRILKQRSSHAAHHLLSSGASPLPQLRGPSIHQQPNRLRLPFDKLNANTPTLLHFSKINLTSLSSARQLGRRFNERQSTCCFLLTVLPTPPIVLTLYCFVNEDPRSEAPCFRVLIQLYPKRHA